MDRATAHVEDGTVYVYDATERYEVGELATILDLVGGPAWTITYTEAEKRRPDLDTSDEGLTVDVVDTIEAMSFGEDFVAALAALPAAPIGTDVDAVTERADGEAEIEPADGEPTAATGRAAASQTGSDGLSPRLGLFLGRLLENLEHGLS